MSFLRAENDTLQERLKHFEGRRPLPHTLPLRICFHPHHLFSLRFRRSHQSQTRRGGREAEGILTEPAAAALLLRLHDAAPQVNAARDERIKEIETKTQLEMEAKDEEVAGLQASPSIRVQTAVLMLCRLG